MRCAYVALIMLAALFSEAWHKKFMQTLLWCIYLRNRNHVPCFYRVIRNTNRSLEEREMLWQHEPQASVSTALLSCPKLSRVFLYLDRNTE